MTIQALLTPASILYNLPSGKPNPKLPRPNGPDTRERVLQKGQKGQTCLYYALCRLRERIRSQSSAQSTEARQWEKLGSNFRKEISSILLPHTLDRLPPHLPSDAFSNQNHTHFLEGTEATFLPHLKAFLKQTDDPDIASFIEKEGQRKLIEIAERYLPLFAGGQYEEFQQILETMKTLPLSNPAGLIYNITFFFLAHRYGLRASFWLGTRDFKSLRRELEAYGPLCAAGKFGRDAFSQPSYLTSEKVGERTVWTWNEATLNLKERFSHAVILIGVKKTQNNSWIYFIDPADRDDPTMPTAHKVYKITWKVFVQQLHNHITGTPYLTAEKSQRTPYFYYHPQCSIRYSTPEDRSLPTISHQKVSSPFALTFVAWCLPVFLFAIEKIAYLYTMRDETPFAT